MTTAFDDDDAASMVEALSFELEAVVNGALRIPVLFQDQPLDAFSSATSTTPTVNFASALWPAAARGDVFEIDGVRWAAVKVERNSRARVTTVQLEKQAS